VGDKRIGNAWRVRLSAGVHKKDRIVLMDVPE